VAAVDQLTAIGGRRRSPDRRSPVGRLASTLARSEMKTLLLSATALAVVSTVSLSPAMANRFGPFDTRLIDDSDRLSQNGVNAATTTANDGHYEWQYHYGRHGWKRH
jgi:hypothetical protein